MADAVDEMLRIALVLDVTLLVAVLISIWAWVNRSKLAVTRARASGSPAGKS